MIGAGRRAGRQNVIPRRPGLRGQIRGRGTRDEGDRREQADPPTERSPRLEGPVSARAQLSLGWGTMRMYGSGCLQPPGNRFFASASDTAAVMMTSPPGSQFAGVASCLVALS